MRKMKKSSIIILISLVLVVFFTWFFMVLFEGEKPKADIEPLPEYIKGEFEFDIEASDQKTGLRNIKVSLRQDGPTIPVFEKKFSHKGAFNKKGTHSYQEKFTISPKKFGLFQGQVNLTIEIHDFSKRRGGDGNLTIIDHKMIVDTIRPSIAAITKSHNINIGGSGLIIYKTSLDTSESGVFVNDMFFKGAPFTQDGKGIFVCYFALPFDGGKDSRLYLWARDSAGNEKKNNFYYHIRGRKFRQDNIRVTDKILEKIINSFSPDIFEGEKTDVEKYLFLNKKIREENHAFLKELCQNPTDEKLWDNVWIRMKNAATMATFGDERKYFYNGDFIDKKFHLGIDLASLAMSPVQASNNGKVIYAQDLGIYGQTVVIDHGQGLYTIYGHLSEIDVNDGQIVKKGDAIGLTGSTGLATGDHLHFGFLIQGIPVNPIEWWDAHWIKDNIDRKIDRVSKILEK